MEELEGASAPPEAGSGPGVLRQAAPTVPAAPFKVPAFEMADECDPVSRRIQSVNTLRRVDGKWLGCNTDVAGFLSPLESVTRLTGKRATILGAIGHVFEVGFGLCVVLVHLHQGFG